MSYAGLGFGASVSSCMQDSDCPTRDYVCCDEQCVKPNEPPCGPTFVPGDSEYGTLPGNLKCPPNSVRNVARKRCVCKSGYTHVVTSESPWGHACLKPGQTVQQSLRAGAGAGGLALGIAAALGVGYLVWSRS